MIHNNTIMIMEAKEVLNRIVFFLIFSICFYDIIDAQPSDYPAYIYTDSSRFNMPTSDAYIILNKIESDSSVYCSIVFLDGYILVGHFVNNIREDIWRLYKYKRNKRKFGRLCHLYNYRNGVIISAAAYNKSGRGAPLKMPHF